MENTFMDKIRSFFGWRSEPPRNDFRNPIWNADDDDDDDELYSKQQMEIFKDPLEFQREFTRHMQDMFKSFGGMFGDMKTFFHDDTTMNSFVTDVPIAEAPEDYNNTNSIRDYYLKPGFHNRKQEYQEDMDLDGKISSNEISGLLKKSEDGQTQTPFNGTLVPGRSFCQTIITTSVTKSDGTVETKRIVKKGNDVIEETITRSEPISATGFIFSDLTSMLKNFY